jgi:hypothetical protein
MAESGPAVMEAFTPGLHTPPALSDHVAQP